MRTATESRWVVTTSLSNVINLQRSVKDLTIAERINEYKNVELLLNDEQFVRAKAMGSLLPDVSTWFYTIGQNQVASPQNGNNIYFYTPSATSYNPGAFSSPSEYTYADLEGRTIHFEADIKFGTGASGTISINAYLRRDKVAVSNASVYVKQIGSYTKATHVSYDFVVGGDWFKSDYKDAYFGIVIFCSSSKASSWSVDNIKMTANADKQSEILQAKCLWGTSDIARQILGTLSGLRYRPFTGTGARLNPAAEIGDNIVIDGDGYALYSQTSNFNSEFVSNISAPYQEEVDHEFPYVPATERRFRREIKTLRAELNIQADQIEAKVSQEHGNRSFGWSLTDNNFTVFSGGSEVLKVTSAGASINGHVVATSGTIGGCVIDANGRLQVAEANIGQLSANVITYGTLQQAVIPTIGQDKLGWGSVGENQIQGYAVSGGKLNNLVSTNIANGMWAHDGLLGNFLTNPSLGGSTKLSGAGFMGKGIRIAYDSKTKIEYFKPWPPAH